MAQGPEVNEEEPPLRPGTKALADADCFRRFESARPGIPAAREEAGLADALNFAQAVGRYMVKVAIRAVAPGSKLDPELSNVLSKCTGLDAAIKLPSTAEIRSIGDEAARQGRRPPRRTDLPPTLKPRLLELPRDSQGGRQRRP